MTAYLGQPWSALQHLIDLKDGWNSEPVSSSYQKKKPVAEFEGKCRRSKTIPSLALPVILHQSAKKHSGTRSMITARPELSTAILDSVGELDGPIRLRSRR